MSDMHEETAACLYDILADEYDVLSHIHEEQQAIRKAIGSRNWKNLQTAIENVQTFSDSFAKLEKDRMLCFSAFGSPEGDDVYKIIQNLPKQYRTSVPELFHQVRRKLIASKIENDSTNDYIRITQEFLQGIFDTVVPQRRNTVYTRAGVVRNKPESMVVNTVL